MLPKLTEDIQFLLESEKEPEKETIFITKWLKLRSSILTDNLDVPLFMDKWTNHPVLEPESDLPV